MCTSRVLFVSVLLLFISPAIASTTAKQDFRQGLDAFKQKQYKAAEKSFKEAESKGLRNAQLYYNLGVTYFKLQNYTAAEKAFKQTSRSKELRQLAFYNLGLVAEKQGNKKTARDWFNKAIKHDSKSKTAQLAREKLSPKTKNAAASWDGRLSIGLGYDDNVTLVTTDTPTLKDDTYLETFVYARYPLADKTQFKAVVSWQDYADIDTSDYFLLSGGISHKLGYDNWQLVPDFTLSQSRLNNKSYQTTVNFKLTASRKFSNTNKLALRYRYSDIQSDNSAYDYLQGQRHQFRGDLYQKFDNQQLRWRYQLELNSRQNLPTNNYSPTRHTLQARLRHKHGDTFMTTGTLEFRRSDYEEAAGFSRSDDRFRARLEGSYNVNKDWTGRLRYTYTDNDSNQASEVYSRNDIQLLAQLRF